MNSYDALNLRVDMPNSESDDDDICVGRYDDCDCKSDDKFDWLIVLPLSSDLFDLYGSLELSCESNENILLSKAL